MSIIGDIQKPVQEHIDHFEVVFRNAIRSKVSLLDLIMRYLTRRKGKQIRPLFVFLSAELSGGITDASHRAAAMIELLHTATLVHDDVVDDSNERRGAFSINALWKNKIAVLAGDYLLSRGLLLAVENSDFRLLQIVSAATREMSEGELLQIEKARRLDIKEEIYYEIIRKKTAVLIAACCSAGASSAGASEDQISRMYKFGELVGMAFQIKDDLFDYHKSSLIGKPNGIDIREQKMTLPLIYTLNNVDSSTKSRIISTVKNHNKDRAKVDEVIELVHKNGGLEYAQQRMIQYANEAVSLLLKYPEGEVRNALERLVVYVISRDK
jgi:octaprenyl-diphosphate synthase